MDELKPCPFCGGKVSLSEVSFCWELMKFKCADCGTEFRMKDYIWNHRVYPPEVQQAVERMKPKKVIQKRLGDIPVHCCPDCGYSYDSFCVREMRVKPEACPRCGQRLYWSE